MNSVASSKWPFMSLTTLSRRLSDHTPILLASSLEEDWGPKPFRSIHAWWSHEDFLPFLTNTWNNLNRDSLVKRLRILCFHLKNL